MQLNKNQQRVVAITLALLGGSLLFKFAQSAEFSYYPQSWFQPTYYEKLVPLFLAGLLVYASISMLLFLARTNFHLIIFGHATIESILFDWLGFQDHYLPAYAVLTLFPLAILLLWAAYSNILKRRKLTVLEIIASIIMGAFVAFMPEFI